MPMPRIHLITTGGTIAGASASASDTTGYQAGSLSADALVASAPPLADLAELSVEQLYSLDSKDMRPENWLGLAHAVKAALARNDVDGVVITHGTDTLEESAFFLDLVLPPCKPVVFTCAMRPATALSPDGPMNLYAAVSVAAFAGAAGLGVLVVANDRIHTARAAVKGHTQAVDAFVSPDAGPIGWARPPQIHARPQPSYRQGIDLDAIDALPCVEILTIAAGSNPALIGLAVQAGARGVVLALPGNGSVPAAWAAAIESAAGAGGTVVRASRTCAGPVSEAPGDRGSCIAAGGLGAVKARIALMVALASGLGFETLRD